MENIAKCLDCGYVTVRVEIVDFHVVMIYDITEKIIPFYVKYRIIGVKEENFEDLTFLK